MSGYWIMLVFATVKLVSKHVTQIKAVVSLHLPCEACQAASLSCITFNRSSLAAAAAALSASLLALQVSRCRVAGSVPVKALEIPAVCDNAQVRWNGRLHSAQWRTYSTSLQTVLGQAALPH